METRLFNNQGDEIGKIELPENIFGLAVNKGLLWEDIKVILANQRKGTAKTKSRAEVRGGGKKPWRQKGIGWARHGSIRSPIWRKGGVVFGPKPRDYYTVIPKRKKLLALLSALSASAKENRIMVMEDLDIGLPKTKALVEILKKVNPENVTMLIGIDQCSKNLKLAVRNIPNVTLKRSIDINCYDVLKVGLLLFTKKGLSELERKCTTKKS